MINFKIYRDNLNIDNKNISWDEYFMCIANLVSLRSKDPCTKVGACIVKNNRIISTGYNGFPNGVSDTNYPWTKGSDKEEENKYFYVVHAELNAILNAKCDLKDSIIYVNKFPCNECTKAIIQSGIKKVIYEKDPKEKNPHISLLTKIMSESGIEVVEYKNKDNKIEIYF